MGRMENVDGIRFLVVLLLAVQLEAISVNPSLCPTNKIAPHKRIANWEYGTGRTFGAFYDLLVPGDPQYDAPNYQNDLQEQPQEDDPSDCGEIDDYDENDLSSLTPQRNRRQGYRDSRGFGINSFFNPSNDNVNRPERPPYRPDRPPNRPLRPPNRPQMPPNRPQRPPRYPPRPPTTNRPQASYPATRPPYWSGGFFGSNEYRPPQQQNPSDTIKPIHEYPEDNQVTYRPTVVGGPLGHVVGVSPNIPTRQDDATTERTFYDRLRTSTPNYNYPTRGPRARNLNNNLFGSFVDLLF